MPLITWGPQILVGIEIVDRQHKRLDLINELHEAMQENRSAEVLGHTFRELVDYTHTHFRTEENLLQKHGYENYAQHRKEHYIFTDQIEIYRDRFEAGALSVTQLLMEYLRGWLVTHITSSDRAYVPTLRAARIN